MSTITFSGPRSQNKIEIILMIFHKSIVRNYYLNSHRQMVLENIACMWLIEKFNRSIKSMCVFA